MSLDAVNLALRHVSETRHLLDSLITSSESFNYPQAKVALKALQRKQRELAKVQAALQAGLRQPEANVVPLFKTLP